MFGNITSCSIKLDVDALETTSKSSGGNKSYIGGDSGWSADFEIILEEDGSIGAGERSYADAIDILQSKTLQNIVWGSAVVGDLKMTGAGLFQNVTINAPRNAAATASFSIQGSGALTKGTFA